MCLFSFRVHMYWESMEFKVTDSQFNEIPIWIITKLLFQQNEGNKMFTKFLFSKSIFTFPHTHDWHTQNIPVFYPLWDYIRVCHPLCTVRSLCVTVNSYSLGLVMLRTIVLIMMDLTLFDVIYSNYSFWCIRNILNYINRRKIQIFDLRDELTSRHCPVYRPSGTR